MEILYVSTVPSEKEFYHLKDQMNDPYQVVSFSGMSESSFKFHSLIQQGMVSCSDTHVLSLIGRNVNRRTHKGLIWETIVQHSEAITYHHLGFLNLPVLKQAIISLRCLGSTLHWLYIHKKTTVKGIVIDGAYVTVLPFILLAAKLAHCPITAIFCDIYEYMGNVRDSRGSRHVSLFHRCVRWFLSGFYRHLDGYILLTEKMNTIVNPLQKPYIIIEGLVDENMKQSDNDLEKKFPNDIVLYAGALREQFGLKNLIEGFQQYKDENARLWIFGTGDYVPYIQAASVKDSRIEYFGLRKNQDVVEQEIKATLLVNPRSTEHEFTQYSFPSKNMEYMVSGTPVLTTRLPGMPPEYFPFVYTIEGNKAQDITLALESVLKLPRHELYKKGMQAKQFVLQYKNNKAQARKILELIRGL